MEDERDAEDAIRGLDRLEFGRKGRRLRVEWTKQERNVRKSGSSRRSSARPTKTLFVINFDPHHTRTRDLERHFDPYGKILNIRIRRNFAFIQFETQEDASKALDATNLSKLMDRVISVEYALKDDDERREGYSPDRNRERSPRRRSPSPYRRERASPDYGRGRRSPSPSYRRERASPDYGRAPRGRTPTDPSPNGRISRRSLSPKPRRERLSPDDYHHRPSPRRERASSPDHNGRGPTPTRRERLSPRREKLSPDDYRRRSSHTPQKEERVVSPNHYGEGDSPNSKLEPGEYGTAESPVPERYQSQSPVARERSVSRSRSRSES